MKMRIKIKSIEAELIDTSSFIEENCKIHGWSIKYHICWYDPFLHSIEGEFFQEKIPNIPDILNFLKKYYDTSTTTK